MQSEVFLETTMSRPEPLFLDRLLVISGSWFWKEPLFEFPVFEIGTRGFIIKPVRSMTSLGGARLRPLRKEGMLFESPEFELDESENGARRPAMKLRETRLCSWG